MNAILVLKKDHKEALTLIRQAIRGTGSRERQKIVRNLVRELSMHAAAEEQLVYPLLRKRANKLDGAVLKGLEEHHLMKMTLSELDTMKMTDERLLAKLEILRTEVQTHVAQEESTLLPALERLCSAQELDALAQMIQRAKRMAPTHPHPGASDEPPGNILAGAGAALLDRAKDGARELAGRVRRAVNAHDGRRTRATPAAKRRTQASTRRGAHA
jgi:Hemerythrin HHE cation binding domain